MVVVVFITVILQVILLSLSNSHLLIFYHFLLKCLLFFFVRFSWMHAIFAIISPLQLPLQTPPVFSHSISNTFLHCWALHYYMETPAFSSIHAIWLTFDCELLFIFDEWSCCEHLKIFFEFNIHIILQLIRSDILVNIINVF